MKKIRFLVHKFGSSSPRELKEALSDEFNVKRLLVGETTFKPKLPDLIVNWGCIKIPNKYGWDTYSRWLNPPDAVCLSTNRIKSLTKMKEAGVNVPEFTTSTSTAQEWYDDGESVVCREKLRSFGGRGITVRTKGDGKGPIGKAALYTRYRPKRHEYRVHVFRGVVIDVAQKKRRKGFKEANPSVDSKIRSYGNGWVFCREGVAAPDVVLVQCLRAVEALGLDFAAVDVGWTEKGNVATVYECNTAPGLEGTTLKKYAEAIRAYASGQK